MKKAIYRDLYIFYIWQKVFLCFLDNFFLEKMEFIFKKIRLYTDKDSLIDLYSIGQKIHENVVCKEEDAPCDCLTYLEQLNLLNENMDDRHSFTDEEKISFFNLSKENPKCFLLIDQIIKKYGAEIYQLDKQVLINVIFFEVEKIKSFLNIYFKIKALDSELYVYEKSFL